MMETDYTYYAARNNWTRYRQNNEMNSNANRKQMQIFSL